ncbi:unnamed protein product, partial [Phaeothamnion confervicola]
DFVYEGDAALHGRLDAFADWRTMDEAQTPLVVAGISGTGKSAAIVSWLAEYRRALRGRHGHQRLLVFYHAVGCSRHSANTHQLLRRLLRRLRQHFDLTHSVPDDPAKLSWALPHFLALAGARGRVLLVIDGLHRLQTPDGDTGLQWLPLEMPPNVRLIVAATAPDARPQDGFSAARRDAADVEANRDIDGSSVAGGGSGWATGGGGGGGGTRSDGGGGARSDGGGCGGGDVRDSVPEGSAAKMESDGRKHRTATELQRRGWPALWVGPLDAPRRRQIIATFLAKSQGRALPQARRRDKMSTGGTVASDKLGSAAARADADGGGSIDGDSLGNIGGIGSSSAGGGRNGGSAGGDGLMLFPKMVDALAASPLARSPACLRLLLKALEVAANHGFDLRQCLRSWLAATTDAALLHVVLDTLERGHSPTPADIAAAEEAALLEGGFDTLVAAFRTAESAEAAATTAAAAAFESKSCNVNREGEAAAAAALVSAGDEAAEHRSRDNSDGVAADGGEDDDDGGEGDDDGESSAANRTTTSSEEVPAADTAGGDEASEEGGDYGGESDFEAEEEEECEEGEEASENRPEDSSEKSPGQRLVTGGATATAEGNDNGKSNGALLASASPPSPVTASLRLAAVFRTPAPDHVDGAATRIAIGGGANGGHSGGGVPGGHDLNVVPVYLRGGRPVKGFGSSLGKALALLHTARHGLRERELWALLGTLAAAEAARRRAAGTEQDAEARLLRRLLRGQNRLIDSLRAMDTNRDGHVSHAEFRAALTTVLGEAAAATPAAAALLRSIDKDGDGALDMRELLDRFGGAAREVRRRRATEAESKDPEDPQTYELDVAARHRHLAALAALGVMFEPGRRVLVLGLEAERLREVVSQRYVGGDGAGGSGGGGGDVWHARLVHYFQAQPPTPRRCEELPWQLTKCHRWHVLKSVLVDLRTFGIMWRSAQLRQELVDYWKLLAQGPLYASAEAERLAAEGGGGAARERLLGLGFGLHNSSHAAGGGGCSGSGGGSGGGGISGVTGRVTPFDLVFEYNHAIESWQASVHPTIVMLGGVMRTIGEFLTLMSKRLQVEGPPPPFVHAHLDFAALSALDIDPALIARACGGGAVAGAAGGGEDGASDGLGSAALAAPRPVARGCFTEYFVVPHYYYQRWLWVQFPWMALAGSTTALAVAASSIAVMASATTAASAAAAAATLAAAASDTGPAAAAVSLDSTLNAAATDVALRRDMRFWRVKRIDPTGAASVELSEGRKRARIRAGVGKSLATALLSSASYGELLGEIAGGMRTRTTERRLQRRCASEAAIEPYQTRPLAGIAPSDGSRRLLAASLMRRGGAFSEDDAGVAKILATFELPQVPEIDALLANAPSPGDNGGGGNGDSGGTNGRGGGSGGGGERSFVAYNPDGWGSAEQIASLMPGTNPLSPLPGGAAIEHASLTATAASVFPLSSAEEAVATARNVAVQTARTLNALRAEARRKRALLGEARRVAAERDAQDDFTTRCTQAGEATVAALLQRLEDVSAARRQVRGLGGRYARIVSLCAAFPPHDDRHLGALKEQV